jgi:hypothetical protein
VAGEWIKYECGLPGKPEVMAITAALGWDDTDLTVGKLMRLFAWFDQQTTDGNATGVTPALLDKFIGVTGFVQALMDVRWIVADERGLSLHNFGKHNGETAKARAQTAKRVANHRSNAATVTPALAKEEKRREEKKEDSKSVARGSRLPTDFNPDFDFAVEQGIANTPEEASKFRDYWNSQPGQKGVKTDWQATWRNWCRNAKKPQQGGTGASETAYQRAKREQMERDFPNITKKTTLEVVNGAAAYLGR